MKDLLLVCATGQMCFEFHQKIQDEGATLVFLGVDIEVEYKPALPDRREWSARRSA